MMEPQKRCTQCGILKDPNEFRKYTYSRKKGTSGRYSKCKSCEAINARYLRAKDNGDIDELLKITKLYETLESLGLRTPLNATPKPKQESKFDDDVEHILLYHASKGAYVPEVANLSTETMYNSEGVIKKVFITPETLTPEVEVPEELQYWLDVPFEEWQMQDISPEYLQETIYESLKAKYRPQVGVDRERFIPLYDDTYKAVLNDILRRFDEFEEMMMSSEEEE